MYTQRVDRSNPGCLLFLVDQSASMSEMIAGGLVSKAEAVAEQLNTILLELVQRCTKSPNEPPRPYFAVGAIGYHTDNNGVPVVGPALSGALAQDLVWTSDLALHPLRIERRDGPNGGAYNFPIWVEPRAIGGTPMCEAMNQAGQIARAWVDAHPTGFPPIVINLSDGEATDGDLLRWTERLSQLATSDGQILVFNAGISNGLDARDPIVFPHVPDPRGSEFARVLFDASSPLPPFMVEAAVRHGYTVQQGARGFAMDADLRSIVLFLNVGTSIGHLLR